MARAATATRREGDKTGLTEAKESEKTMSEEQTNILPPDKAPTTQPMLEAILAKVNQLGDEMSAGFAQVNGRLEQIEKRVDAIEQDMREVKEHLRKIDIRLGVVSDDLQKLRADSVDHERRIADLERKAS